MWPVYIDSGGNWRVMVPGGTVTAMVDAHGAGAWLVGVDPLGAYPGAHANGPEWSINVRAR